MKGYGTRDRDTFDSIGAGGKEFGREGIDRRSGGDDVVHDGDPQALEAAPHAKSARYVRSAGASAETGLGHPPPAANYAGHGQRQV
jgi:hypothetical protein